MRILLMGNPNVGKSVVFSRLTGVRVVSANYSGTTVEYMIGNMKLGDETVEIVDVPGSYTLDPTSEAEEIARKMLQTGDLVINVVDATNLERNLYLTLQLMEREIPVIVALNLWDETVHRGIEIKVDKLEELLRVPVVPTSALTGQGIKDLVDRIPEARSPSYPSLDRDVRWASVGNIASMVQQ
ncbi:MAG: FeoB small GTPase domain-containing protein, partial [Syntrophales bacterium]|nr:FeoB small GTPase domain-containing protein [Syntrophales bacterium]